MQFEITSSLIRSTPITLYHPSSGMLFWSQGLLFYTINISFVYHSIRGAAHIKLYVYLVMCLIGDTLISRFGATMIEDTANIALLSPSTHLKHYITGILSCSLYFWLHASLLLLQHLTIEAVFRVSGGGYLTMIFLANYGELKSIILKQVDIFGIWKYISFDSKERVRLFISMIILLLHSEN